MRLLCPSTEKKDKISSAHNQIDAGNLLSNVTIEFIFQHEVPTERMKDVTYGQFVVCTVRPAMTEPNQTRFTVGGNRINYPGAVVGATSAVKHVSGIAIIEGRRQLGTPRTEVLIEALCRKEHERHVCHMPYIPIRNIGIKT